MNQKIKPASRLSIVFILAVVVSGSILTYFSINNISNLKELTEKRIIEEQREVSTRFIQNIQNNIEKATAGFKSDINPPALLKDSTTNTANAHGFIMLPFILKTNGSFLYPNFTGIPESQTEPKFSNQYKSAFNRGEGAEFARKNFKTAKRHYLSCLNYATTDIDSAKTLNALGRISVKLEEQRKAIEYYSLIISKYHHVRTQEGIPYVYFAIPQLIKLANEDNGEELLSLVEISFEKMKIGSIPLNIGTRELLDQVAKWTQKSFKNSNRIDLINELEKNINQQLQLVKEYKNEIAELLKGENLSNHLDIGNGFTLVNPISGYNKNLLLVNTNFENPFGFLIDGKILFDTILNTDIQYGLDFDYNIEFPTGYINNTSAPSLIYTSQVNPYFPGQIIQIEPRDENLINNFVKRRSWIYGIATALLLVAMLLGVVLILRDVRRERRLMRLRADFISNVTHELKTPLTSIYMFAESLLLKRIKKESDREEYLSIILKESERLKRMINNILEFSKMEKGKSEYHFVDSNLSAILYNAIHDLDYWFEKEKFEVVTDLDEDINAEVDPEKMKQVISNLLSNAIKYSTDNKKISIRLFKTSDGIILEIEDKGMGISEAHLSRIFEKYFRVDNQENISGTGLGLTVVKEIIDAHNGTISVTSEIDKGSKFSITLKQQISEA